MQSLEAAADPECPAMDDTVRGKRFYKVGYGIGYARGSFVSITLFNLFFSSLFLVLSIPVMFIIGTLLKLYDGGPIFYWGVRLGLGKKPFVMLKFRTLPVGAQKIIGKRVFSDKLRMTVPLTRFLRKTRLDELPQLINVLKGEMDFIGPRPVRPEVYNALCRDIRDYDLRFLVRPGLIGPSQLFTPHSAPNRLRSFIDNRYIRIERRLSGDVMIIGYSIALMLAQLVASAIHGMTRWAHLMIRSGGKERRAEERVAQLDTRCHIASSPDTSPAPCRVLDMNETCLKIAGDKAPPDGPFGFVLSKTVHRNNRFKTKRARCSGKVLRTYPGSDKAGTSAFLVAYTPVSPLNQYMVDQYFLSKSILTPKRG